MDLELRGRGEPVPLGGEPDPQGGGEDLPPARREALQRGQRVGGEVGEQPGVGVQDQVGQMVLGRDHRRARDDALQDEALHRPGMGQRDGRLGQGPDGADIHTFVAGARRLGEGRAGPAQGVGGDDGQALGVRDGEEDLVGEQRSAPPFGAGDRGEDQRRHALRDRPAGLRGEFGDAGGGGRGPLEEQHLAELLTDEVAPASPVGVLLGEADRAGVRQLLDIGEDRLGEPDDVLGRHVGLEGGAGEVLPGPASPPTVGGQEDLQGPSVLVLPRAEAFVEVAEPLVEGRPVRAEQPEEVLQRLLHPGLERDPVRAGEVPAEHRQLSGNLLEDLLGQPG